MPALSADVSRISAPPRVVIPSGPGKFFRVPQAGGTDQDALVPDRVAVYSQEMGRRIVGPRLTEPSTAISRLPAPPGRRAVRASSRGRSGPDREDGHRSWPEPGGAAGPRGDHPARRAASGRARAAARPRHPGAAKAWGARPGNLKDAAAEPLASPRPARWSR